MDFILAGWQLFMSAEKLFFGSVCSGIEAASVAWDGLGWKASWFAEIEAFPSAVLSHHWPSVPNLGDMTKIRDLISTNEVIAPDVLVGGTPCQAFSVAGARKSLDDDRGQLTLEYVRLLNEIDATRLIRGGQPAIAVWENVPGVLSTKDNAFGCFLGALAGEECELQPSGKKWTNAGCVFGPQRAVAWRVLDAQYFGVAQRRRRVFVVASARNGFNPAKILFEWEGVRRDIAPGRSAGQETAGSTGSGFASSSFAQYRPVIGDGATIKASGGDLGGGSENLIVSAHGYRMTAFGQYADDETASTMKMRDYKDATDLVVAATDRHAVAVTDIAGTLTLGLGARGVDSDQIANGNCAINHGMVRRLTPIECERLQGFPDNHTQIPYRNKPAEQCPDGPRYAALGNSMAVPVMRWIGERIKQSISNLSQNME